MATINLWEKYTSPAIDSVALAVEDANKNNILAPFLLIDNGSTDETKEQAPKKLFLGAPMDYHRNEEMWGFQKSVNFGVNKFIGMGYDYVLVLNNDIVLHPKAITRLGQRMEKGDVGMATCMDVTGEVQERFGNPEDVGKISDVEKESVEDAEHPCFSAFMVSGKCWETVGEFDEAFHPAYYEDNDYHYRMQLAEIKAIVHPPAMFFHYGSRTQNEAIFGRKFTDSHAQHMEYVKKWGGDPGKEVFKNPYNDPIKSIKKVKQS